MTLYSDKSVSDAQSRVGFSFRNVGSQGTAVERMLATVTGIEGPEGYLSESDAEFTESNVNDLRSGNRIFVRMTVHKIILVREKDIISVDGEAGGYEEFIVVDTISVNEDKYVLVGEPKRSSLGVAIKQCLLALKDMKGSNGGGVWWWWCGLRIHDNGRRLENAELRCIISVLLGGMDQDKELWVAENSILVNCIYVALANGGIVKQDVVVG
ncbi:hypothetical protein DFH27DRAFT_393728 [Peziza echinospora]|nr:hypothetical protein DFH27DRAFT_393728 [Peziza echinospora]